MVDNKGFIRSTNFLKYEKKIDHKEIAIRLGVERHKYDSWRSERVQVPDYIERKMEKVFDELRDYETESAELLMEPETKYENAYEMLIGTQKTLIETLEKTNEHLSRENERLRGEIEALMKLLRKQT